MTPTHTTECAAGGVVWPALALAPERRALPSPCADRPRASAPPSVEAVAPSDGCDPQAVRERAFDEGFQAGLLQGEQHHAAQITVLAERMAQERVATAKALADDQMRQELDRLAEAQEAGLRHLAALLERLPQAIENGLCRAEDELVALAHDAVCAVLGQEAVTGRGVRSQVRQALRAWQGASPLAVHLHPQDLAALQALGDPARVADGIAPLPEDLGLQWIADDTIVLGGCVVHASGATLDARLQVQWDALRTRLLDTRATQAAQGST